MTAPKRNASVRTDFVPVRRNKPSKHARLVCWWLLYRVDVQKQIDGQDELNACHHAHLELAKWDEEKSLFPREWAKLLAKRQRRLAWYKLHGEVPNGWTPPDPKDPVRTANKPLHAYLARRKLTLEEFEAKMVASTSRVKDTVLER